LKGRGGNVKGKLVVGYSQGMMGFELVDQKKRNVMQWTNIWTPKKALAG